MDQDQDLFSRPEAGNSATCGTCRFFRPAKGPYGYCHKREGREIADLIERCKLRHREAPCSAM